MKPRYSIFYIFMMLLSGCTNRVNSVQALTQWDKAYGQCLAQEQNSPVRFPEDNAWFNSLSSIQKKHVVLYIYQEKMYQCSARQQAQLKQALTAENNQTLLKLFRDMKFLSTPDKTLVENIDPAQLHRLSQNISIFNLGKVAAQLHFRER
ncbi:hypothetical protein [Vibrio spartinae]|uniref:Lipoprotein n=1 Tax=Vibrio spartinae TaxID=1918945 RepID=A0A1N6M8Z3_9VIBR|nr:hypothetical protein [Vibrio spartinae]SIO95918.1 hypothetical protein VSP9026_03671 [Vibrio spartinae]